MIEDVLSLGGRFLVILGIYKKKIIVTLQMTQVLLSTMFQILDNIFKHPMGVLRK